MVSHGKISYYLVNSGPELRHICSNQLQLSLKMIMTLNTLPQTKLHFPRDPGNLQADSALSDKVTVLFSTSTYS